MDDSLSTGDRATLRVWHVLNVLGWSMLAILLATFLRIGFASAADLFGARSRGSITDWLTYWEYAVSAIVPAAVVCGLFIGSLIGAKVAWKPVSVSGGAAALFAAWNWLAITVDPTPHAVAIKAIDALLLSLTVLVAVVVAARRRRIA